MADLLLPAPASVTSPECDCKWVRRPMGGSVIQLDIPRDAVSVACHIKSTRGHTRIQMTPWDSKAQYRRWNDDTYKPSAQASHLTDKFHAAERRVRTIRQNRRISLHHVARVGRMPPAPRIVPCCRHLEWTEPCSDEEGSTGQDKSTNQPPTLEEAFCELGRVPTMADLGPHSPVSCSSSLVPYIGDEDSDPEEDQEELMEAPELMETKGPVTAGTPAREGMGINAAPDNYQPASPRYVRADEDSEDEEVDIEAPYLAPRQALSLNLSQNEKMEQTPAKDGQTPMGNPPESSGDESMPELINLRDGENTTTPPLSRRVQRPETLKLTALGATGTQLEAAPETSMKEVPEEQIIYIDDDAEPTPLQLLEKQVDSLLMPPPVDTAPVAQKDHRSLGRGVQLFKVAEEEAPSPGTPKKRSLQERRKTKALKLKIYKVAKMRMGPTNVDRAPELAKVTSAIVPLQWLRIQDDLNEKTPEKQ